MGRLLVKLGYETAGLHIHQGIFEYSASSFEKTTRFAKEPELTLITIDLAAEERPGYPRCRELDTTDAVQPRCHQAPLLQ